jgi:hypothetical protein
MPMQAYNERDYDFRTIIPSKIETVDEAARLMFELDGAIGNLQRQADIAKNDAVTKRRYLKGQQWPDLQHSIKEAKRVRAAVQERKGQLTRASGQPVPFERITEQRVREIVRDELAYYKPPGRLD